jgi:hypothetical protein
MSDVEEKSWLNKISKFEIGLSIIGALIQIGLFISYALSALTASVVVPTALSVALSFLLLDYLRKRKILARQMAEQLLREQLPALAVFVEARRSIPDKLKVDKQVLYENVVHTFRITGSDGSYTRHVLGQNISGKELQNMFYAMTGETSVGNGSVNVDAFRRLGNELERLEPTIVWSSQNVKVIGVNFNPPVAAKIGKLDVNFSGKWPGAFISKNGYLFAAIPQCTKGVGRLTIKAIFDEVVSQCSVWTWDLKRNELKEFERLSEPRRRAGLYTLKWQRTNPEIDKIYILRYKRNGTNLV